jgi:hypothetical protein
MSGFVVIGVAIAGYELTTQADTQELSISYSSRQHNTSYRGSGRRAIMAIVPPGPDLIS